MGLVAAVLLPVMLCVGCTHIVAGTVHPAPGLTPRPLTGQTVNRVLLSDAELSKMFRQAFEANPRLPARFGGPEQLYGSRSFSASECIGVIRGLQKNAYESRDVRNVAQQHWRISGGPEHKIIEVEEGVVAVATPADADALFAQFSSQWKNCDGTTVTSHLAAGKLDLDFSYKISDVRTTGAVLLATVTSGGNAFGVELTDVRAVGVRVNCLVDVDNTVFSDYPGDPQTSALDVARAMMQKVSDLS